MLSVARERFDPHFQPNHALDYGCGVGRCTLALAKVCKRVVGMDVSPSMLEEAGRNCAAHGVDNVTLVASDDQLTGAPGLFDLIHCVLVFQHVRPARGEQIFAAMLDRLSEGGLGAVQLVYQRSDSRLVRLLGALRRDVPLVHGFANLAYGRPFSDPLMEKNVYDLKRLFSILEEHDCGEIHVRFMGGGKLRSVILFFRKGRRAVPVEHYA